MGSRVGARQFTDEAGRVWVAWNVTPESGPGAPARESWIVFETTDGTEKRRLLAYPEGWAEMPELDLHALLASAGSVRPSRLAPETGARVDAPHWPPAAPAAATVTASLSTPLRATTPMSERVVRSFRYPGGRLWSVCVVRRPAGGGAALLRFSAGARHIDLHDWPEDWASYADDRLAALVRSVPRGRSHEPRASTTPRRRHDDPRT